MRWRLTADTAGYMNLPAGEGSNIYLLTTRLRADRFATAYFKVTSPARFEIYVDGQMKRDKMRTQDSLHRAESAEVQLRMEPQRLYKVAVKVLVTDTDSFPCRYGVGFHGQGHHHPNSLRTRPQRALPVAQHHLRQPRRERERVARRSLPAHHIPRLLQPAAPQPLHHTLRGKEWQDHCHIPAGYKILGWTPLTSQLFYKAVSAEGEALITVNPATLQETVVTDNLPSGSVVGRPMRNRSISP